MNDDFYNNSNKGQGLNALIPPKNQEEQNSADELEKRINNKVNDAVSNFSGMAQLEKEDSSSPDFEFSQNEFRSDLKQSTTTPQVSDKDIFSNTSSLKETAPSFPKEEKVFYIETEKIKPNPLQPRKNISPDSIQELAQSIREYGILEPLIVSRQEKETESGTEVEYILIAGERRWRAARYLGMPTVPAIIKRPSGEIARLEMALIENIQRQDLDPISKAQGFQKLIEEFGLTQQALAIRLGKSRETIANTLRLLQLPYEAQKLLQEGVINEGHARAILLFSNPEKRRVFLKEILAKKLSGREAWELAQNYLRVNKKSSVVRKRTSLDPQDLQWKEKLENILQTPVVIKRKGEKGAIELKFYSSEDFQRILKKLVQE